MHFLEWTRWDSNPHTRDPVKASLASLRACPAYISSCSTKCIHTKEPWKNLKQIVFISYIKERCVVIGWSRDVKRAPSVRFCTPLQKRCRNVRMDLVAIGRIVWKIPARLRTQSSKVAVPITTPDSVLLAIGVRMNTLPSKDPRLI